MKKIISMILTVTIILSCICVVNVSAASGQDIVNEARKWIGTKHGHSDGSGGPGTIVDCCGLVLQSYKKFGYTLPWTVVGYGNVTGQKDLGTKITNNIPSKNYSNLQMGDLIVFYGHSGTTWHIGIYSGNGYVINAQSSGVKEAYLSDYWYRYAVGVRRILGNAISDSSNTNSPTSVTTSSSSSSKPNGISNPNTTLRWKELNSKYNVTTKELQECLNYIMKAGLKVDGVYGIGTHDAVKEFQGKYGLTVDGDAGPKTLKKVNEVLSSMGGGHTHSFTGTWHEAVHPHREYKKCSSCGETELTGNTVSDANCAQCTTPGKPELLNMKKQYYADSDIKFTWNPTKNTTHYNLYVHKKNDNGEYETLQNNFYAESGMTLNLGVGEYKVFLQPTNSNAWTDDKSTWRYTNSDMYYFEVTARHTHEYTEKYDKKHPHEVYEECDCGDIQYSDETKKVKNCEECYPHEHDYVAKYETTHPHEKYWLCDCGEIKETGETKKISGCLECYPIVEKRTLKLQIGIPNMYVDGVSQEIDPGRGTAPVIQNERTLLPIRMVMETFGAYVLWDEIENKVTIYAGDTTMEFWINSTRATVDRKIFTMDVAPIIINERTFMPLRFIAENMGLNVGWNGANQTVTVEGEIS